nr:MAG TPA: hypothetical protein [Caudoviricetes sp.]
MIRLSPGRQGESRSCCEIATVVISQLFRAWERSWAFFFKEDL